MPAATIRKIAYEFIAHAHVGETIEIEGKRLPYRPVAVSLGKTVNNGWGGYECVWARTTLAALVGGLEVPGGTLGTTVRLNWRHSDRLASVTPGPDGLMAFTFNPTDKAQWSPNPNIRNAYRTMVPLAGNGAWSQALGPTHFSWMFLDDTPKGLPRVTLPDVWFVYRTNPGDLVLGHGCARREDGAPAVRRRVRLHARRDQSLRRRAAAGRDRSRKPAADPDRRLEIRRAVLGPRRLALRQPAVAVRGEARDFTDIATELAQRTGLLAKYNAAINRGAAGMPLKNAHWRFRARPRARAFARGYLGRRLPRRERGVDRRPRAERPRLVEGAWPRHQTVPAHRLVSLPALAEQGLRFELPYQERLKRVGAELGSRLHEHDMHWWDKQLPEYQALPVCKDFGAPWVAALRKAGGKPHDYPFWLLTARSMQYAWGGNVGMQLIKEVADNVAGHRGVIMNTRAAKRSASPTAIRSRSRRRSIACAAAPCCARASAPTRC